MSPEDKRRYARQTILPGIGAEGQQKLAESKVLIAGCGGLGGPVAAYLAGAGIGELTLVDGDSPAISNLHRQVFFSSGSEGTKAEALAQHCLQLNPGTCVRAVNEYIGPKNIKSLVESADLVLDCTDDAITKHLINDACVLLRTPLVYAAAQVFEGYLALFPNLQSGDIHLRDLFPKPDPTLPDCATTGVLPTAVGTVALLQANAALCYLLGIGEPPIDCLLTYGALNNQQHRLRIRKTYTMPVTPPWTSSRPGRAELETDNFDLDAYDAVFSMLDKQREPDLVLPEGVIRVTKRNPFGQCLEHMDASGRYLVYCNSGKLSLMLAAQLQKEGMQALSLRGGLVAFGR